MSQIDEFSVLGGLDGENVDERESLFSLQYLGTEASR